MSLIIWNVFQGSNILITMRKKGRDALQQMKNCSIWQKLEKKLKFGIRAKKEESGIGKMLKLLLINLLNISVDFVKKVLQRTSLTQKCVVNYAGEEKEEVNFLNLQQNAPFVEMNSPQKNKYQGQEIEKHAPDHALEEQFVYNLTVEKDHVYYANGILVSNCDTAYDAVNATFIDKIIVYQVSTKVDYNLLAANLAQGQRKLDTLRNNAYGSNR